MHYRPWRLSSLCNNVTIYMCEDKDINMFLKATRNLRIITMNKIEYKLYDLS